MAIPLIAVSLFRIGTNWWLLPVFVVAILLSIGGVLLYFRNARIEFDGGRYTAVSMFGSHRTFAASDAASVVTVRSLTRSGLQGTALLMVLRPDGSKLLKLRSQTWEVEQFARLASDLNSHGVPTTSVDEPITADGLRDRYPKAISWGEAHPVALGLLLALVTVIVIFFIVVVSVFLPAT